MYEIESLNEKSIESWCEKFSKIKSDQQLSDDELVTFTYLFLEPQLDTDEKFKETLMNGSGLAKMAFNRLKLYDYEVTVRAMVFLLFRADRPGIIVMYLTYLQYICFKREVKIVTIDFLADTVFPSGFQSMDDLQKAWDDQKCDDGTNLLDKYQYMNSIRF